MTLAKNKKTPIVFVTGNKHKIEIAQKVLGLYEVDFEVSDIDAPEIQSDCIDNIAKFSAEYASNELNRPVFTTDVGFDIPALNGFPGAYGKYVFDQLGVEGILALMQEKEDRTAFAIEVLAFSAVGEKTRIFKKTTKMKLLTVPKGQGSVMDQIMVMDGDDTNYGSLSLNEKLEWWGNNSNYFHDFAEWYKKHTKSGERSA